MSTDAYLQELQSSGMGFDAGSMSEALASESKLSADQVEKVLALARKKSNPDLVETHKFTIKVTRATANIAGVDLEVPIFGLLEFENKYARSLNLPTGLSRTQAISGSDLEFTFTQGANSDVVTISSTLYPYISMLKATQKRTLKVRLHKYTVTPAANADQVLNQAVNLFRAKPYGSITQDGFEPSDKKTEIDNQSNIVTIKNYPFTVNDERFLTVQMPDVANLALNVYMEADIFVG